MKRALTIAIALAIGFALGRLFSAQSNLPALSPIMVTAPARPPVKLSVYRVDDADVAGSERATPHNSWIIRVGGVRYHAHESE
jgi:hypothetical protein